MKTFLKFREHLGKLSHPLLLELEQLLTVIRATFRAEHNDDGTHTSVTATAIATDGLTVGAAGDTDEQTTLHGVVRNTTIALNVPMYRSEHDTDGSEWGFGAQTGGAFGIWSRAGSWTQRLGLDPSTGQVTIGTYVQVTEMSDPPAGATNTARVYCRDNGAGKTQLCVRFATGAIQVLATEP